MSPADHWGHYAVWAAARAWTAVLLLGGVLLALAGLTWLAARRMQWHAAQTRADAWDDGYETGCQESGDRHAYAVLEFVTRTQASGHAAVA